MASDAWSDASEMYEPWPSTTQLEVLESFYATSKLTDLTIACKDRRWRVHKLWLSTQSVYFENACSSELRDGEEAVITLSEDDPQYLESMLRFLYTGTYSTGNSGSMDPADLVLDVQLFILAAKYSVDALRRKSIKLFENHCRIHWDSPWFSKAIEYIDAASPSPTPLKDIIDDTIRRHRNLIDRYRDRYDLDDDDLYTLVNFNEDIPGRQPHDRVQPANGRLALYRWKFSCPGTDERECKNTFYENIPLGEIVSFTCPLGHNRKSFEFWARYGEDASGAYD